VHQQWSEANFLYECVPGYFRASPNTASCTPCALDEYQDEPEQSSCKKCTANTRTYNTVSISMHDCAFCGHDSYLTLSESDGTFSCLDCVMCTVQPCAVHMQQMCPACGFHDYDQRTNHRDTASHGKFCVLERCLSTVRTDDFVDNNGDALIQPLYKIQPSTAFSNMNNAFLTTLSDTASKEPLETFAGTFQLTTLPWWEIITSETAYTTQTFGDNMQGNLKQRNDQQVDLVYMSFVDFFF